jgi:hypothetical protein
LSSSSGSDGPPGSPGPSRVIDERVIDRRLLSLLIARHGEPPRARPLTRDEEERAEIVARRDRALAAADPRLVHHIERHERSSARVAATQEAALAAYEQMVGRRRQTALERTAVQVRDIGELRELEPSEELYDAMKHRTPQAFLRDLHRPVQHFGNVELRRVPSPTAGASLARARTLVSEIMAEQRRAVTSFRLTSQLAGEGMVELRSILARPWEESRPENPLPMASRAPTLDDMRWFGSSGGYDPDV